MTHLTSPSFPNGLSSLRSEDQVRSGILPKPIPDYLSRSAEYRPEHYRFSRKLTGELEKTTPPIKDYDKQIGGALFGFIVGAWCFFLVAAGYW